MKMMLMARKNPKPSNQQGFASIVIALILIIVLALLTVGFAQLARREQKNALDKQLSTQAFYAAETGVNDTVKLLDSVPNSPDNCLSHAVLPNYTVGSSINGVQYTCVLVNLTPPNIKYDNVPAEADRYIQTSTTVATSSFTVNWGSADGSTTFPASTATEFKNLSDWTAANYPAVLQFSVTPLGDLSRAGLAENTFTVFLYPVNNGAGSIGYTTASGPNEGAVVAGNCNTANDPQYHCKVTITGITGGTGPYLFRVINHYDPSNISINGIDSLGHPLAFDGQAQIDATGKAHEVLKRIQVRVPRHPTYDLPGDALDAQNICKRFSTDPTTAASFDTALSTACKLDN